MLFARRKFNGIAKCVILYIIIFRENIANIARNISKIDIYMLLFFFTSFSDYYFLKHKNRLRSTLVPSPALFLIII